MRFLNMNQPVVSNDEALPKRFKASESARSSNSGKLGVHTLTLKKAPAKSIPALEAVARRLPRIKIRLPPRLLV